MDVCVRHVCLPREASAGMLRGGEEWPRMGGWVLSYKKRKKKQGKGERGEDIRVYVQRQRGGGKNESCRFCLECERLLKFLFLYALKDTGDDMMKFFLPSLLMSLSLSATFFFPHKRSSIATGGSGEELSLSGTCRIQVPAQIDRRETGRQRKKERRKSWAIKHTARQTGEVEEGRR